ncbi:hypothetical protein N7488_008799 [Penicillium malachiteum]|nr:hypothetical protein N7488_008799 [Penicillium malachiteum]
MSQTNQVQLPERGHMHLLLRSPQGAVNRFHNKPFRWDSAGTGISLGQMPPSAPAGGQRSGRVILANGAKFDFTGVYITSRNGVWYLNHGQGLPRNPAVYG